MKKVFISMVLMVILIVTGCTSSKETQEKQEETTIVYCSDCGKKSKEVAKFCSGCGVEAKWIAEKPEEEKEMDKKESNKNKTAKEDVDSSDGDWVAPSNCLRCNDPNVAYDDPGIYCQKCLDIWRSGENITCENGFEEECYGCSRCSDLDDFTVEQAISIAEDYYSIKNHPNDFISADSSPKYDSRGMYYLMWAKSKEMIEQGGNGIVFSFKLYEDGTIVEN